MKAQTLDDLGYREIGMLAELLTAYTNTDILGAGVNWGFNPSSGCVYLFDEDYNVAMMNDDKLEMFYSCGYCGYEGFKEDYGEVITHDGEDHLACECCAANERDPEDYLIRL